MTTIDLTGLIDAHIHTAPDVRPRLLDDIQAAQAARDAGMRAVVLKSHVTLTADRAAVAEKVVGGVRVLGGLVLNTAVGGLNPAAVEAAIHMGARIIWMPTISAARDIAYRRCLRPDAAPAGSPGITILTEDGALLPVVHDILDLVAAADVCLASGHLAPDEVVALLAEARRRGLRRILVTHPELAISNIPLSVQQSLAGPGVWFEHCYNSVVFAEPTGLADIAQRIRAVGPQSVVLSSDMGRGDALSPVDGLRAYLSALLALGMAWGDLVRMTRDNPAAVLGL